MPTLCVQSSQQPSKVGTAWAFTQGYMSEAGGTAAEAAVFTMVWGVPEGEVPRMNDLGECGGE